MTNSKQKVDIGQHSIETPAKSLSDTYRNKINGGIDTQENGKPDFSHYQVEEYRNRLHSSGLEDLKSKEESKSKVSSLAENLGTTEVHDSQNLKVGFTAMASWTRGSLDKKSRLRLIKAAKKAEFLHVYVTPMIEETYDVEKIKSLIESQVDYGLGLDENLTVVPSIKISKMTENILEEVVDFIENNYSKEEVPLIATERIYPLCNSNILEKFKEYSDRGIVASNPRRKVHGSKDKFGSLSAEYVLARMDIDLILDPYYPGPYNFGDEDEEEEQEESLEDLHLSLVGDSMAYESVGMEHEGEFECHCYIHRMHSPGADVKHWGAQDKEKVPEKIHNRDKVGHTVRLLRRRKREGLMQEEKVEQKEVTRALEEFT